MLTLVVRQHVVNHEGPRFPSYGLDPRLAAVPLTALLQRKRYLLHVVVVIVCFLFLLLPEKVERFCFMQVNHQWKQQAQEPTSTESGKEKVTEKTVDEYVSTGKRAPKSSNVEDKQVSLTSHRVKRIQDVYDNNEPGRQYKAHEPLLHGHHTCEAETLLYSTPVPWSTAVD